jgi:sugar lactone lactonase YvrE
MRATRVGGAVAAALAVVVILPAGAAAVNLRPGDLVVSESVTGQIDKVNPKSGAVTPISNNTISNNAGGEQDFAFPFGLAFAGNGDIFVADRDAFDGHGGVIRVNPTTGAQSAVSSNAISMAAGGAAVFNDPGALLRRKHGKLFVTDFGAPNLARVDVQTGKATVVSADNKLSEPWGLLGDGKSVLAADSNAFGGDGGVIRVNPGSGSQQKVSSKGKFREPYSLVHAPNDKLYVSDANAFSGDGGVIRVNPDNGKQTNVASAGHFRDPGGMAKEADGKLVIADYGIGGVIRLNPATGHQQLLVPSGLSNPLAIAVVPR